MRATLADIQRLENKGMKVSIPSKNKYVVDGEIVKPTRKMVHTESELQQNCVKVFRLMYPKYRMNFFSIPNGSYRSAAEASILSGEGIMPGACDTILTVPRGKYGAAFIEFKTSTGRLSEYQVQFIKSHNENYYCAVVRSVEDFLREIKFYMELK
jgi:hypothetical protein